MKIKRITYKKLLAIFLSMTMILSLFSWIPSTYVKAAGNITKSITRIADKDTTDDYIGKLISEENGSRYAGRLWADKSVFSAVENKDKASASIKLDTKSDGFEGTVTADTDFAHVFSALGSSQIENENVSLPLDVVFVLDTSSTMAEKYSSSVTDRLYKATLALNGAFDALMSSNSNNRVAMITYDTNAEMYLPLDRYESIGDEKDAKNNNLYFIGSDKVEDFDISHLNVRNPEPGKRTKRNQYVQLNVKSETTNEEYQQWFSIHSGTNTHQGLYKGLSTFLSEENNTTITDEYGRQLQRIPVVILLSDGEPSLATTTVGETSFRYHPGESNIEGDYAPRKTGHLTHWWEPNDPGWLLVYQPNERNNSGYIGCPSGQSWGCALPVFLMAGHMKQEVNKKYFGSNYPSNYPGTQIITVGVDSNAESDKRRVELMRTTLDPASQLTEENYEKIQNTVDTGTIYSESDINKNVYTKYLYEAVQNYFNPKFEFSENAAFKLSVDEHNNWMTLQKPTEQDNINKLGWDDIRYNDKYLDVTRDNLGDELISLVGELKTLGTVFTPISGTNEAGVDDSITYVDPIGDYMEIKDDAIQVSTINNGMTQSAKSDMSMLLFGNNYGMVKTAVYDYQFNLAYDTRTNGGTPSGEFDSGWYSSDDPETAYRLTNQDEGSWKEGNVYYVDRFTAAQFVPTLDELNGTNDITEKQQNTVYTLYRFALDQNQRNKWRLNPAYDGRNSSLKLGEDYDNDYVMKNQSSFEDNQPNGVYRLSDIRVWVEDTGDYKDENPGAEGDDGLFNGVGFDQALYVNIPANALPLQVSEITFDEAGQVSSYETNINDKKESTPVRLFYAVGIKNEIKNDDGTIDLAKISQTYLDSHKDSDGNVYFISNYFSAVENDTDSNQGDPVVTFSPGNDNRYYVFQKALPIYSNAYQYYNGKWNKVEDTNWNGGRLLDLKDTPPSNSDKASDGDVILVKSEVQKERITDTDKNYFFAIDYYEKNKTEKVQYVVSRTGQQLLASDFDYLHRENMLCWANYDEQTGTALKVKDYESKDQAEIQTVNDLVLATNPGGLRVSDLANDIKEENITETATDVYHPLVSNNSGSGDNQDIILKAYLGNNGVLSINDTMLLVTKQVVGENSGQYKPDDTTLFSYRINIDGFSGEHTAIKTEWNPEANAWFRRISKISVITDNNGLLQSSTNNDELVEYPFNGNNYYVYVPDEDTVIGGTDVYVAPENTGNEQVIGSREWTLDETGNTVEIFKTPKVQLVPINVDGTPNLEAARVEIDNFEIARMAITGENLQHSEVDLTSNYYIRAEYLTDTVDFDNKGMANIELSSGQGLLFNAINYGASYEVVEELKAAQVQSGWKFKSINGIDESSSGNADPKYSINHEQYTYGVSGKTGAREAVANYINTTYDELPTTGNLIISKKVTGSLGDSNEQFHFIVELSDDSINDTYGDLTFENGKAEFTLKDGESKTATGLPSGITYSVTEAEANQNGYVTSSTGDSDTITANTTLTAAFVNSKGENEQTPGISIEKYHKLSHQKDDSYHTNQNEVQSKNVIDYKIVVTNNSDQTYQGVNVIDPVPRFLSVDKRTVKSSFNSGSRTITEGYDEKTHQVSWQIGDLSANEKAELYFSVEVPEVSAETFWINHAHLTYDSIAGDTPSPVSEVLSGSADHSEEMVALAISDQSYDKHQPKVPSGSTQNNTYHSVDLFENSTDTPNLYTADVVEHLTVKNTPASGTPQLYKEQAVNSGNRTINTLSVNAGDTVTYYLTVYNSTGSVMTNVEISDVIPTNLIYLEGEISTGGKYSARTNTVSWNINRLEVNETVTVWFKVQVPSSAQSVNYINDFRMTYSENTTGKDYVSNEVEINQTIAENEAGPKLTIQKKQSIERNNQENYSEPTDGQITTNYIEVREGDIVTYYIYVTNIGDAPAHNVVITDPVPDGLILVENAMAKAHSLSQNGNVLTWNIDEIQPGESSAVEVQFKVVVPEIEAERYWRNIAFVSSAEDNSLIPSNPVVIGDPPITSSNTVQPGDNTNNSGTNASNTPNSNNTSSENQTTGSTSTTPETVTKVTTTKTGVTNTGASPQTGVTGGIGLIALTGIGATLTLVDQYRRKKKADKK